MTRVYGFYQSAWKDALGLAVFGGMLHAICETTLLGYVGVQPTAIDLALFALLSIASGVFLVGIAGAATLSPPLRTITGAYNSAAACRRVVWSLAMGGYLLVFLKIISFWSGWTEALKLLAMAVPVLAWAGFAVFRHARRAAVCIAATACVVAALCSLQLASAAWSAIPAAKRITVCFHLVVLVMLCCAALLWATKAEPSAAFESIWRGTAFLAVLAAVWGGLWVTVFSTPTMLQVQQHPSAALTRDRGPLNILLVVLDTVRGDHLDLFGYERETMPNLREFARTECQVAMHMLTTGSWTAPSHGSMFTGLYPSAHGAHYPFLDDESATNVSYPLREDIPTLAEFLDAQGYQTAGIAANFVILSSFGLPRGFEYYDASPGSAYLATAAAWLYRFRLGKLQSPGEVVRDWLPASLQRRAVLLNRRQPLYRRAREITDGAVRWLDNNGARPFFLFLNYLDAHPPYFPPPEDDERFVRRPAGTEWLGFPDERYSERSWGKGAFTPEEEKFLIGQYDAELVGLDREFGRLLQYLRDSRLMENLVILVTTDHGESLFDHGFLGHGVTLYGSETGGFFLARTPASLGDVQPSPLMQFVDFFPTIATAIGAPVPSHVQGSPWGHGRDYALSELYCRDCAYSTGDRNEPFRRELVAVVLDNHKVIRSTRDPSEAYDLHTDPKELQPLAAPAAKLLERAEAVLAWRKATLLENVARDRPADQELLRKMRSLGYVK